MVLLIMFMCAIFAILAGGFLGLIALLVITAIGGFVVWRLVRDDGSYKGSAGIAMVFLAMFIVAFLIIMWAIALGLRAFDVNWHEVWNISKKYLLRN